jgi:hypothetical protein
MNLKLKESKNGKRDWKLKMIIKNLNSYNHNPAEGSGISHQKQLIEENIIFLFQAKEND